jgi:hypothetical protein
MQGLAAAVDRRVRGRVGGGVTGLVRVVRAATAMVLLGAVLLIVVLVGRGVAVAREPVVVSREPAGSLADLVRASARREGAGVPDLSALAPGPGAGNPDLARALVAADGVLRRPGPAQGAGPPGAVGGERASPRMPDRSDPREREGSATVPPLGQARKPEVVAVAAQPVMDDGPLPGGPDPTARTRSGDTLVVAQAAGPAATPPRSWHTVSDVVDRVGAQAESLAAKTKGLDLSRRASPGREVMDAAGSVDRHADAARAHERNNELDAARQEAHEAIGGLWSISRIAPVVADDLQLRGWQLRSEAEEAGRHVETFRQALGGYGASAGQGTPEDPSPSPRSIAEAAAAKASSLEDVTRTQAPKDVGAKFAELVERVHGHARAAASYEKWYWRWWYSPADGLKDAHAAVEALDQVVIRTDELGHRKGQEAVRLDLAARSAQQLVEEARRALESLPRQPAEGSRLEKRSSPEGEPMTPDQWAVSPDGGTSGDRDVGPAATFGLDASAAPGGDGRHDPFTNEGVRDALPRGVHLWSDGITDTFNQPGSDFGPVAVAAGDATEPATGDGVDLTSFDPGDLSSTA